MKSILNCKTNFGGKHLLKYYSNYRLEIDSREILLDTESFKIQSYFLEEYTNKYKNILHITADEESDKIIFENVFKVLSLENSNSKQIYESLSSTVGINKTNVKNKLN